MIQKAIQIKLEEGLEARPVAMLVQVASQFESTVYLLAGGDSSCPATELCQRLGVSRASLYRAFAALEDSGLITRKGKTITVVDPVGLETAL